MSNGLERIYLWTQPDGILPSWHSSPHPTQLCKNVEYIRTDLAMTWTPIAEADLKDGENVIAYTNRGTWYDTKKQIHHTPKFYESVGVTHILRIKPPSGGA